MYAAEPECSTHASAGRCGVFTASGISEIGDINKEENDGANF
jgi:hypothetical protein